MLFNSLDFAIFLPVVLLVYWCFHRNLRFQNYILLVSSYVFYAWWDYRFLFLILGSTLIDFIIAIHIVKFQNKLLARKTLLVSSLIVNLGALGFFKYYHFFVENFVAAFTLFGLQFSPSSLDIILPVGISFYTFQTLSYTIDVYHNKLQPTYNFVNFANYVSFFPQLVAGPIERAKNLLPQFSLKKIFNYDDAVIGLKQILWGFFKKLVIADNCAVYANVIFDNASDYNGSTLVVGAVFFTFQIYGDFSGYSDIAIGTSRLFGFQLMQNFNYPYFSRDIAEFWRRWHISLSSWFRDYLYIPLGGSRRSIFFKIRNIFILFLISGFWHGANWTFVFWGALNALFFLPLMLTNQNRKNLEVVALNKSFPSIKEAFQMILTFAITVFAWIFFRAKTLPDAFQFISGIFSSSLWQLPKFDNMGRALTTMLLIVILMFIEWLGRENEFALQNLLKSQKRWVRWFFYACIVNLILFFMETDETPFIYFQF